MRGTFLYLSGCVSGFAASSHVGISFAGDWSQIIFIINANTCELILLFSFKLFSMLSYFMFPWFLPDLVLHY